MMLFNTRSTAHLAPRIALPKGTAIVTHFPDGELRVHVEAPEAGSTVWVLAATPAPGDTILELLFLLDALERAAVHIKLLFTYFGYARQDRAAPGEPVSAQVISTCLQRFPLKQVSIVHPHSKRLATFLTYTPLIWCPELCPLATTYDAVVALDAGAYAFAQAVAAYCGRASLLLAKERYDGVSIKFTDGTVRGKRLLIVDDILATGTSMITAAQVLLAAGATEVSGYATHAILAPGAHETLEKSCLRSVYVTNSVPVPAQGKLTVLDCAPWITEYLLHA